MTKQTAFTTLEMVIVLGLVAIIMLLAGPQLGHSQQCIAEQQFWQSFRQEWHWAQIQAQLTREPTTIEYVRAENAMIFRTYRHRRSVTVPNSLQVGNFLPIEMKPDGYVCPGSRWFYSQAQHCKYRLVIQMARGEFDVKKE
ncbi:type II secretion system protein [Limosilactobacillus panis]|uniref:Type II secretion system protein n=1 Tax=Limosilactobacillus panis TaxID=47493 RepID=A0ABT7VNY4_9LACO|nr:type II secretion system protein [Limosilactobacillus panis]MDM8333846.1 type II secretion system protein [Limosilactobacillus panis]